MVLVLWARLGCFEGCGDLVLGFGRDWVVMGGQCWGMLSYPKGLIRWAGIGLICSVDRFVFATRTLHSVLGFFPPPLNHFPKTVILLCTILSHLCRIWTLVLVLIIVVKGKKGICVQLKEDEKKSITSVEIKSSLKIVIFSSASCFYQRIKALINLFLQEIEA